MSQDSRTEDIVGEASGPGALDGLLGTGPTFTGALRGYDRMQVDNYVAWAETEIAVARRESDHLLSRYAACSADLQNARRRLAGFVRDREDVQARARAVVAAAVEEADRISAEARCEAHARLEKVDAMRAAARIERDIARVEARGLRAEAAELLAAARSEAAALIAAARGQREAPELVVVPDDRQHPVAS